jgi:uncharacterized phage protein (TIGR01671 family)
MREILFRGKDKNGKWEYGFLSYASQEEIYYIGVTELLTPVDPNTVGQFTGLLDKNGKKIFEGDIMNQSDKYGSITVKVTYCKIGFKLIGIKEPNYWNFNSEFEIIGNIQDNPELKLNDK